MEEANEKDLGTLATEKWKFKQILTKHPLPSSMEVFDRSETW